MSTVRSIAQVVVHEHRSWFLGLAACMVSVTFVTIILAHTISWGMGPLSRHMLTHILIMNAIAPALVVALRRGGLRKVTVGTLWYATALQLLLVSLWHLPFTLTLTHRYAIGGTFMTLSLLAASLWFWLSVAELGEEHSSVAIAALLLTGKVLCLLGALLALSRQPLFAAVCGSTPTNGNGVWDQHLAGLIMLVVCPVVYLGAGVGRLLRMLRVQWTTEH